MVGDKKKTIDLIKDKSIDDISFILGRYCTPNTYFLCYKHFGFLLDSRTLYEEIASRQIEDIILGVQTK